VPQTLNLPFKLEDTGSNFWGSLDECGRPSRGLPSLKIWKRSNQKWGRNRGRNIGFQITDNTCAQMNGEDAKS